MGKVPTPILDPYSTLARNPQTYAIAPHQSKPQLQVQDQPKSSQSAPIGKGFSISSNSGTTSGSAENSSVDSTDQVVIYHIRPSGTACGKSVCVGWGEINLAYDKPCQDSDHMNAYPIDGQTVYVNDFFFEKYPEAPANYVLVPQARVGYKRECNW